MESQQRVKKWEEREILRRRKVRHKCLNFAIYSSGLPCRLSLIPRLCKRRKSGLGMRRMWAMHTEHAWTTTPERNLITCGAAAPPALRGKGRQKLDRETWPTIQKTDLDITQSQAPTVQDTFQPISAMLTWRAEMGTCHERNEATMRKRQSGGPFSGVVTSCW